MKRTASKCYLVFESTLDKLFCEHSANTDGFSKQFTLKMQVGPTKQPRKHTLVSK